jgi:hypothetical protein
LAASAIIILGTILMREGIIFQNIENTATEPILFSRSVQYGDSSLDLFSPIETPEIMFAADEEASGGSLMPSEMLMALPLEADMAFESVESDYGNQRMAAPRALFEGAAYDNEDSAEDAPTVWLHSVTLHIDSADFDRTLQTIEAAIAQYQGYIELKSELADSFQAGARYASLNIRVPTHSLDALTDELQNVGTVTMRQKATEDVSVFYREILAQLAICEERKATLNSLLQSAQSISDAIDIEDKISELQSEINSLTAQKNDYDARIAQAVLYASVAEMLKAEQMTKPFFSRAWEAFVHSVRAMPGFFGDLMVFISYIAPYVICAGVVVLLIIVVKKIYHK